MAEEDLIFGKNRHFFGGIEPSNMIEFKAVSSYNFQEKKARVVIAAKLPVDTVIEGQQLCSVAGAVIRKKEGSYPKDEFDGTLIADIKEDSDIVDEDIILNHKYYYAAFPYTSQGVYNRSYINRSEVTALEFQYYYGYDLVLDNGNTEARVTYPSDVQNAKFTPAFMDFSKGEFNYGSWPSKAGQKFMPKPCMLTYEGRVFEYLNEKDYTKNEAGFQSQAANDGFNGNAMMEWPVIYTKREVVGNVYKFRCSDIPLDSEYECWSNYDKDNNKIDHFYTPIYFGSSIGGKMRSISGKGNFVSQTAQTEVNQAKANGDGWYTEVVADRFLIQDLLVLMAKSTDTQKKFGHGNNNTSSALGQGLGNNKGLFWGASNDSSMVKVFGMENWWGNIWRRTAGWINANGTQKIKITRGTKDGSSASDYNFDGTGYLTVPGATPVGSSGGYINKTKDMSYGRVPYSASGSATTYEADGLWFNNGQNNYALCGGGWSYSSGVGAFSVTLGSASSFAGAGFGAALSYKKLVK